VIADGAFYYLDAPVKRMGAMDVPVPFSPVLEDQTVPTPEAVAEMCALCSKREGIPFQGSIRFQVPSRFHVCGKSCSAFHVRRFIEVKQLAQR
jgi:hypothetical protein